MLEGVRVCVERSPYDLSQGYEGGWVGCVGGCVRTGMKVCWRVCKGV